MSKFIFEDCGRIEYKDALERQTSAFDNIIAGKKEGKPLTNRLFFCEHNPVITMGKSAREENLLLPEARLADLGISLFRISRGGDVTYHGPGQITVYPVFDLDHWKMGLKEYIYNLEQLVINFLKPYNVDAYRMAGMTGVWTNDPPRKICAIGVRSSHFVVMHGLALNVNTHPDAFSIINPCGFKDKGVTSMAKEIGMEVDFETAKKKLLEEFEKHF